MNKCPRCGHENLPSFPTCSRCGTPFAGSVGATTHLPHASMGVPQPPDDYAALMSARAQKSKSRSLFAGIALVALAGGGCVWYGDYKSKGGQQAKLDFFEKWADLEKRETGSFFNCVMSSEVDMNL